MAFFALESNGVTFSLLCVDLLEQGHAEVNALHLFAYHIILLVGFALFLVTH